jgi:hypothetical protein
VATVAMIYSTRRSTERLPQTTNEVVATSTPSFEADQQEYSKELAAISQYCVEYYMTASTTLTFNGFDFTTLRPLSDYTCGKSSEIRKLLLSDGRTMYFVSTNTLVDCGSGGCGYNVYLEEKPGLVRRIKGFDTYDIDDQTGKSTLIKGMDGVFGFLSFDTKNQIIRVYDHINSLCGTEDIYQIGGNDLPTLIASYDTTCEGAVPNTFFRNASLPSRLTAFQ